MNIKHTTQTDYDELILSMMADEMAGDTGEPIDVLYIDDDDYYTSVHSNELDSFMTQAA